MNLARMRSNFFAGGKNEMDLFNVEFFSDSLLEKWKVRGSIAFQFILLKNSEFFRFYRLFGHKSFVALVFCLARKKLSPPSVILNVTVVHLCKRW